MPFTRPTLAELVDRIQQDLVSRLELVGAVLRRSVVYVLSRVIAGAAHMLHGHLEYLGRQVFPDESEGDFLERQADLFGINRTAATFAVGDAIVTGTNGTVIPAGTAMLRSDGARYTTDAEKTVATLTAWAGSTAYVVGDLRRNDGSIYQCAKAGTSAASGGPSGEGTAIVDGTATWRFVAAGTAAVKDAVTADLAGADGNAAPGVALAFESPIAGADSNAIVAVGELSGGTDEESDDDLRVRLIERLRSPPHGGNEADYIAWAKEVAGVTRAWVDGGLGAGTVRVYFVRDNDVDALGDPEIIPSESERQAVEDHLEERRPVTAALSVVAPTAAPIAMTIKLENKTAAMEEAVTAELEDMLIREAEPGGTILLSQILVAVGIAEGVEDFDVTNPTADVVHTTGQLPTLGVVTYQEL